MSIFSDAVSTVGKSAFAKIIFYVFLFLCFMYVVSKVGNWVSERFSKESTRTELAVQVAQQATVINAQETALEKNNQTLQTSKDLTIAAIRSMEDHNVGNVKAVTKQAQITSNLDKASTINKAEVIKITALEKDEVAKQQKLIEADERLMQTQNSEIEAAYKLALERSHLPAS